MIKRAFVPRCVSFTIDGDTILKVLTANIYFSHIQQIANTHCQSGTYKTFVLKDCERNKM
jgi:hypothetical protein